MLGALWFSYLSFGTVNGSMAPLISPIGDDLGLSHSAMGVVLGAWALVYIGAAIPAGTWLDRVGTRKGLATGVFLVALSGIARAVSVDFVTLFVAVGIFGIGGPLMSVGAPKMIAQWFSPRERGTAVGIYMTGPFMGTAFAFSSANSLFMPLFENSWRITVAMFAIVGVVGACFGSWSRANPPRCSPNPAPPRSPAASRRSLRSGRSRSCAPCC
jgi:MFS family permease